MPLPHIVVVCFDQLRPFELPCYGGTVVRTPHLDAFAAEAVRVRLWDDLAKSADAVTPPIERYLELAERLQIRH